MLKKIFRYSIRFRTIKTYFTRKSFIMKKLSANLITLIALSLALPTSCSRSNMNGLNLDDGDDDGPHSSDSEGKGVITNTIYQDREVKVEVPVEVKDELSSRGCHIYNKEFKGTETYSPDSFGDCAHKHIKILEKTCEKIRKDPSYVSKATDSFLASMLRNIKLTGTSKKNCTNLGMGGATGDKHCMSNTPSGKTFGLPTGMLQNLTTTLGTAMKDSLLAQAEAAETKNLHNINDAIAINAYNTTCVANNIPPMMKICRESISVVGDYSCAQREAEIKARAAKEAAAENDDDDDDE